MEQMRVIAEDLAMPEDPESRTIRLGVFDWLKQALLINGNEFTRAELEEGRRSPLNENILRTPGYSARKRQLEKVFDLVLYLFGVAASPFFIAAAMTESVLLNWIFGIIGVLFVGYCFYRAVQLSELAIRLHLGIDAELAADRS